MNWGRPKGSKGKPMSAETKAKISKAVKAAFLRKLAEERVEKLKESTIQVLKKFDEDD